MKKALIVLVAPLLLMGCNDNEKAIKALRSDIISLKRENAQLRLELLTKPEPSGLEKLLANAESGEKIQEVERKIEEIKNTLRFHVEILTDNLGILKENTNLALEALEARIEQLESQPTIRRR